jgi:hypothetical protein
VILHPLNDMPHHYTKNIVEASAWCNTCNKMTMHAVFDGRLDRCKNEHPHVIHPPKYDDKQEELFKMSHKSLHTCPQCEWQPMETAPRDGIPILVNFGRCGVHLVSWEPSERTRYARWCVDDRKFGPYPLRGYLDTDVKGWMYPPKATP